MPLIFFERFIDETLRFSQTNEIQFALWHSTVTQVCRLNVHVWTHYHHKDRESLEHEFDEKKTTLERTFPGGVTSFVLHNDCILTKYGSFSEVLLRLK